VAGLDHLRAADKWMSIASAVLLIGYFVVALFAGASPSSDPQRGMAQGFILFVLLLLLSIGGVLWFAAVRNHPWLLRTVFVFSILPALSLTAQHIFLLLHRAG
jgi:hypothetical protein